MNIAYTVDIQGQGAVPFANQLCNSIYSLKKNNQKNDIEVNVFFGNMDERLMDSISYLQSQNFRIKFQRLQKSDLEGMQKYTKQNPASSSRAWCGIVYARLWLAKYLPECERCLYLDSDTMVRGDIKELYETDLDGKSYGMVMGCIPEYGYNSGVILMDLKKIRDDNRWEKLTYHLEKYAKGYFLPDQTTINRFYRDDIFELPLKFNYPPYCDRYATPGDDADKAVIWHFYNGNTKPCAFTQADWCKVDWNYNLREADALIKRLRIEEQSKSKKK